MLLLQIIAKINPLRKIFRRNLFGHQNIIKLLIAGMQNLDSHAVNINQPRLVGKTDILKTPVVAAGTAVVVISEQHTVKLDPAVFNVIAFDRLGLLRLGSDNRLKVKFAGYGI